VVESEAVQVDLNPLSVSLSGLLFGELTMRNFKNWPLLITGALALVGLFLFSWLTKWGALTNCFTFVKVGELPGKLAPLAFAAAVIERAVEILISPWRDEGASKLEKAVALMKAKPANSDTAVQDAAELKAASDALDAYQGETQRRAFAVSIVLSALVSVTGFPSLGLFVDTAKCAWLNPPYKSHQGPFFHCVDVILSAALLAGGADGIHSIVNAVTSFFNATAERAKP